MLFSTTLYAQSQNNTDGFKDHLRAKEIERKNAVNEYVKEHKIPLTGTGINGEFMYLHHIANDAPVYYTTRGESTSDADMTVAYIRIGNNEWKPLESGVKLEMQDNAYLSIRSNKEMTNVYILNSEGKYFYKSKRLGTKELSVSTKKMGQEGYVVCINTTDGIITYSINIQ